MIDNERSYEVSIWTLQDSFITVLKPSNLENKGTIQNPDFNIKDDGEETFSLDIPMYIQQFKKGTDQPELEFIENPIWFNVRNGNIIASMRKIKVIFNKATVDERVFEFVINKVIEKHEGFEKYCHIDCEGLAFNELGKQGYRIALEGEDDVRAAQDKWVDNGKQGEKPEATLQFWADKVFANSNWSYEVRMDWNGYNSNWDSDKVYEEEFVSSWIKPENKDELIPEELTPAREKCRIVNEKESNRYNLSQSIAEAFQVFCRYEYEYDNNYHIIDRKVIFYNNFIKEKDGMIDFTFRYNTKSLSREMDSTDLCSKMFVSSVSDTDMPSGSVNIIDTSANKSLEDYLFNFDYLYGIGTITKEQYDEVKPYEAKLRPLNIALDLKSKEIANLEEKYLKFKAKVENAKESYTKAEELINTNSNLRKELTNSEGVIEINALNPAIFHVLQKSGESTYFFKFKELGVRGSTIHIYKDFDHVQRILSNEITQFSMEKDEQGNVIAVTNISPTDVGVNIQKVYVIFNYEPHLYYDKVIATYQDVYNRDMTFYSANIDEQGEVKPGSELDRYEKAVDAAKQEYENLLAEKQQILDAFERFMGPALREGTWQPEDEYSQYGDFHSDDITLTQTINFNNNLASFAWDKELFDEEQLNYYEHGVERRKIYYPCINLESIWNTLVTKDFNKLAFVYSDKFLKLDDQGNPIVVDKNNNSHYQKWAYPFYFGSKAVFSFVKTSNGNIVPALILVGAGEMTDDELVFLNSSYAQCRISAVSFNDSGQITENEIISAGNIRWLINPLQSKINNPAALSNPPEMVFPRFQISSNTVKSPKTDIKIYFNNEEKENYKDFYILSRDSKYYVTLKPETLFKDKSYSGTYMLNYTVSAAATAIYLDAIQVLKENSYPKVSYTIEPASVNKDFIHNAYARLGQLAHINDYELKFENTMGYISELQLNLDKPWEDKAIIKNYKTKFEDLFSTIVAQSEQMKKNAYVFGMVSDAFNEKGMLNDDLIDNINERLPSYLEPIISPAEVYAQYEPYIRQELKKSWEEAGEVLAAAVSSVNDVYSLTVEGADILAGFKENIKENLTPTDFIDNPNGNKHRYNKTLEQEVDFFKVGDIWTRSDGNVYMATENSNQVVYDSGESKITSLKGWSLTFDGSLAAIKGAKLDINAKAGTIDILAQNTINIRSGRAVNIAGQEVQIVGNQNVRIMGPELYLGSASTASTHTDSSGVHILASDTVEGGTSAVDITAKGIEMRTANGIKIQSGGGIDISTSDGANTSAIKIDKSTGIYMGSSQPLVFYSGQIGASGSAAAAKLTNDRILFGVTNGKTGTAIDLTKDYIIFGSSFINNNGVPSTTDIGGKTEAAGVKITKDYIRMATGTAGTSGRNYFSMDSNGVKIANASQESNGAIVTINQTGVMIGVAGNVTTDSDGFKKVTKNTTNTAKFTVYAPNFVVDSDGILYAYGAHISGKILATTGQIGGWIIDTSELYAGNGRIVGMSSNYGANNVMFWAGNATKTSAPFRVYGNGKLVASNLYIGDDTLDAYADERINNNSNVQTGVSRAKVFTGSSNPTPPYKVGDVWTQGSTGDIKYCVTTRSSGTYNASDWVLAGKYTDDTTANSKAKITPAATPPSNPKVGDLFISDGTNSSYPHVGRTYRYSGSSWVAISAGVIAGTKLNVDTDSGTINMTAKNSINIASGGGLDLAANGVLAISGAGGVTIGSGSKIEVSSGGNITIDSGGKFIITSDNFSITSGGAVTVKGTINATAGFIGTNLTDGWTIDSNTIRHSATNSTSAGAITLSASTFTRSINNTSRSNLQLAIGGKFGVANDGTLYASGAVLSGYSTTSEMNSAIETSASGITAKFNNYSTTDQMNSAISASATGVLSTVSTTYATKDSVSSSISQSATNILSTVSSTYATQESLSTVDQKADGISLSVTNITNGTTGVPHVATSGIDISGNSITMTSGIITLTTGALITNGFRIDGGQITNFVPHNDLLGWQQIPGTSFDPNTCSGNGPISDGNLGNEVFFRGSAMFTFNYNTGAIIGYTRFPPTNGAITRIGSWGTLNTASTAKGGYFEFSITPKNVNNQLLGEIFVHWVREYDGGQLSNNTTIWGDFTSNYWQ